MHVNWASIHLSMCSFSHSLIHVLIQAFTYPCMRLSFHVFIHSLIHVFIHSLTYPCVHSSIHLSMHSFVFSCIYPFTYPCVDSFIWAGTLVLLCGTVQSKGEECWLKLAGDDSELAEVCDATT